MEDFSVEETQASVSSRVCRVRPILYLLSMKFEVVLEREALGTVRAGVASLPVRLLVRVQSTGARQTLQYIVSLHVRLVCDYLISPLYSTYNTPTYLLPSG